MKTQNTISLRNIVIIEESNNKKGDLFARLMGDLFHALGYDEPRFNIAKSGREIDLFAIHRIENRVAIAECKATSEPIGGSEINKFVGSLDAEKKKYKRNKEMKAHGVTGYYISLSGYTQTAIQQEIDAGNSRVILIDQDKIAKELVHGNIIISIEKGITHIPRISNNHDIYNYVDLLATDKGWIWAFYFEQNGKINEYCLIHAGGKALASELMEEITSIKCEHSRFLSSLSYISPPDLSNTKQRVKSAQEKYFTYLENECGDIQFEGLPTDKDAGSVKVKLENIFVPAHLETIQEYLTKKISQEDLDRESIGKALKNNPRIAILAKPGGGKSTLIKRLAIAYAFPERRALISDSLPDVDLFPIFLRCRELGDLVSLSISEIIRKIPTRAEIPSYTTEFSAIIDSVMQKGNALLLIDGLDEISDEKNRMAFVSQIRTFLATYPQISFVVTSREAGFRVVAGSLVNYCKHYRLSALSLEEIKNLTVKWHLAIIDDSEKTIREANNLYNLIVGDPRILVLADNPLLLTTLLFVKRWAGYLPQKKSVLYEEMIRLLLVTWNVEGHEQLEIEEAQPQLAYVAYWMTVNGQQTISLDDLQNCLIAARKQMPEILSFTNISVPNFIKRVESRSSLLILSGHNKSEGGKTSAIYEFLHLSFQEHLTAKAIVEKYLPEQDSNKTLLQILAKHLYNESWKEVIPLCAVLAKRSGGELKELIDYLISESQKSDNTKSKKGKSRRISNTAPYRSVMPSEILGACIANEIQINPTQLADALTWFIVNYRSSGGKSIARVLIRSKFKSLFVTQIDKCFFNYISDDHLANIGSLISDIFVYENEEATYNEILDTITETLRNGKREEKCKSLLGLMKMAFETRLSDNSISNKTCDIRHMKSYDFKDTIELILASLSLNDELLFMTSVWCSIWLKMSGLLPDTYNSSFSNKILKGWMSYKSYTVSRLSAWALTLFISPYISISEDPAINDFLKSRYESPKNEFEKEATLMLATILGLEWDRKTMLEYFTGLKKNSDSWSGKYSAEFVKILNSKLSN